MKIAYFGLPLGALLLDRDGHTLGPVVLSPIEAPGRRRALGRWPRALDALAASQDFDKRVALSLASQAPDLLVSWFWTRRLPDEWLRQPPLGALGIHPSLLPRHRGPNPYFWAIDAGDALTGVTAHRLEHDYDTGAMLGTRSLAVGELDAWQLARALDRPSLSLLRETLLCLARGETLTEAAQDETLVTWAPEPSGDALRVDFGWTTERVLRRIRALSPTPGLALEVAGVDLFVTRAVAEGTFVAALRPGEAQLAPDALFLRTGDGAIRVTGALFPDTEASATDAADVMRELRRRVPP